VSPQGTSSPDDPTFTWNAVSDATQYDLWITDSTGKRFEKWYAREAVGCPSGAGTCSLKPDTPLKAGTITWWVQASNAAGIGPWSAPATFTLQPLSTAALVGPSGNTAKPTYQFRWNAVPGATWHYLRVIDSGGTTRVQTWYTTAEADCTAGGSCSVSVTPTLSAGAATWSIQPWNATLGYGTWSAGMTFTPVDPLSTPTLIAPTGAYMGMPSVQFRWNAVSGATDYQVWVTDAAGVVRVQTWYTAAATSCASGGVCSITLNPTMSPGTATWWIQAKNAQIASAWSAPMTFTPNVPLATPVLVAPTGTYTALPAIQFLWSAVPGASEYRLWITDGAGVVQDAWYSAAATNCASGSACSLTLTPTLSAGTSTWWIMARNVSVTSPWSAPMTVTPLVTPPSLSVTPGTYLAGQTVTVSTPYDGATTRYTTTGAVPTVTDPVLPASSEVMVDRSLSLCARTWIPGHAPSAPTCGTYTLQAQPPAFTPGAGVYAAPQSVILLTPTPDATIRYTTDGTEPTDTSPVFTEAVSVDTSMTLRAVAFRSGWSASPVTTAAYDISYGTLAAPVISPGAGTYLDGESITIAGPEGATLRYTVDGTLPTESSPLYTGPLTLSSSVTVAARAFRTDWTPSETQTADFQAQVAAPSLSVPGGTYGADQVVNVSTTTPDAILRYTTNGQDPGESDSPVPATGEVLVDRSLMLRVRAWAANHVPSDVASTSYTLRASTPSITPAGGVLTAAQSVTLESTTPGVTIRYTLDGTEPTVASPSYAAPLTVSASATLKAVAFKHGWSASDLASVDFAFDFGTLATPVISPAAGTYVHGQALTITGPPGATLRYTTDGTAPASDSPVYSGPLALSRTMTLSARAFQPDWEPSGVASASFTAQVSEPTLSVGSGTYADEQIVVVAAATPGATVRYSTDGQEPTASDSAVAPGGHVVVDRSMTLRVRAWAPDHIPSATTAATYTLQPAAPVITPPGGEYAVTQRVVVASSTPDATIRYTTDGTEPSENSPALSGPIPVSTSLTLKAAAFKPGWSVSPTATASYTLPSTVPTITAFPWPKPNASGWNNSDVTVSFYCTGTVSCPEPVTVTEEGVNLVVSRTVMNAAGDEATATVTLNIDKTPPTVSDMTPADEGAYEDTWSALVSANVADLGSGVARVLCNGLVADGQGPISCTVTLKPGYNSAIVSAQDLAGNSSSLGRRLFASGPASSITISPTERTMLLTDREPAEARDPGGRLLTNVTWTSSDPAILTIEDGTFTPHAPGEVQVTAEYDGFTASATITVLSVVVRADGTVRWTAAPSPGQYFGPVLHANRVDPSVPDFFAAQYDNQTGAATVVHGLSAEGRLTRVDVVPIEGAAELGPDRFGGLLAWNGEGVTRFGGPSGTAPWQYVSGTGVGSIAQGGDGSVFVTEWSDTDTSVVILDGTTGAVRGRRPLAPGHYTEIDVSSHPLCGPRRPQYDEDVPASLSEVAVGGDGIARLTAVRQKVTRYNECVPDLRAGEGPWGSNADVIATVELVEIGPSGTTAVRNIQSYTDGRVPIASGVDPLGLDGSVFQWEADSEAEWRAVANEGTVSRTVPPTDGGVAHFDGPTGQTHWTPTSENIYERLLDNGAVVGHGATIQIIDGTGAVLQSMSSLPIPDGEAWKYANGSFVATVNSKPTMINAPDVALSVVTSQSVNSVTPTKSIRVLCRAVDNSTSQTVDAQHCYITVRTTPNKPETIEGGEADGQPVGRLRVWITEGETRGVNRPSDSAFYTATDAGVEQSIDCLKNKALLIDQMRLPYHFFGPNSNSAVVEMMRLCGRPITLPPQAIGADVPLGPQ
jgi:hypothetical protein